jgi:hypothetical protein
MKANALYKGKWSPPLIGNPAYRGPWKARLIPNPNFFKDPHPTAFLPVIGLGFELWTMQGGIHFDNFIITNDEQQAAEFAKATWMSKYDIERIELEKELAARGISDEPIDQFYAEESNESDEPTKVPVMKRLKIAWALLCQETRRFAKLAQVDPKRAMLAYPFHALNGILFTLFLMYCIAASISWIVTQSSEPVVKKVTEGVATVQQVQKTQNLVEGESLTLHDSSPSRLPRPTSPTRPLKYSRSYQTSSFVKE